MESCNSQGIHVYFIYKAERGRYRDSRMTCNLQGMAPGALTESTNLQGVRQRDGRIGEYLQGLHLACQRNQVMGATNLSDIFHRDGRMMFHLKGIARVTLTESYNLKGCGHGDSRMICNLQGLCA